jgi:Holliday junction DNA helicase RuvA
MISFLKGKILEKKPTEIIIETNSVGFSLSISLKTYETLPDLNQEVSLHTVLIPREDSLTLFGFATNIERQMFNLLTSVNGIGPKSAISILSSIDSNELLQIIATSNSYLLQKFPGIGKKTAERIILELKDKVSKMSVAELSSEDVLKSNIKSEAIEALTILGYNRHAAEKIISEIIHSSKLDMSTENIIKSALVKLMK